MVNTKTLKTIILIHCPDQTGIVHATTGFIQSNGGNIVYLDQHVDKQANVFFMRVESEFETPTPDLKALREDFDKEVGLPYKIKWQLHTPENRPKMAVFVSKYNHCLYDLLSRYHAGELAVDIPFICSNHETLRNIAEQFHIPFFHIPVQKDARAKAEAAQLELLRTHEIDFVVLARYMQIVSGNLIAEFPDRIINIHHSFLPAFAGAKPYHAAYKRGVKIIGATSHYVTEELDAGPIIEQDVTTVSHSNSIQDFITKGRDLEKIVLSRAVKLHVERKTMVYNNKTVIFS